MPHIRPEIKRCLPCIALGTLGAPRHCPTPDCCKVCELSVRMHRHESHVHTKSQASRMLAQTMANGGLVQTESIPIETLKSIPIKTLALSRNSPSAASPREGKQRTKQQQDSRLTMITHILSTQGHTRARIGKLPKEANLKRLKEIRHCRLAWRRYCYPVHIMLGTRVHRPPNRSQTRAP